MNRALTKTKLITSRKKHFEPQFRAPNDVASRKYNRIPKYIVKLDKSI